MDIRAIAAAAALAAASTCMAAPEVRTSGFVEMQAASGFLSSTGLADTCPVATQMAYLKCDAEEWGFVDGYGWIVSSLHDKQHERHRAAFNELEGALQYGRDIRFWEDWRARAKAGVYYDAAIGYPDGAKNVWGPYATLDLKNPFVTPYASAIQYVAPDRKARVKLGLRRTFTVAEGVEISPFCETLWMDKRRFAGKYGANPERGRAFGGAFATLQTGVKASWAVADGIKLTAQIIQYDVVNSQARKAVRGTDRYYAKCDWPVFRIGVVYSF